MVVRPRGWHLDEKHITVDGVPIAGGLVDFGLYFFHNARALVERGSGPYFYLPKLESPPRGAALERRVRHGAGPPRRVPQGSVRATVLIETITAAFEMEEILYELRDHAVGPQRRPLGLPLLGDQELPRRRGGTSYCRTATRWV